MQAHPIRGTVHLAGAKLASLPQLQHYEVPGTRQTVAAIVSLQVLICASVLAQNASAVKAASIRLIAAVAALHSGGFLLGYVTPKLLKVGERQSRTISIEVGMYVPCWVADLWDSCCACMHCESSELPHMEGQL